MLNFLRHPRNSEMPDLTIEELVKNQKNLIKFWVDHCKKLEQENHALRQENQELKRSTLQY